MHVIYVLLLLQQVYVYRLVGLSTLLGLVHPYGYVASLRHMPFVLSYGHRVVILSTLLSIVCLILYTHYTYCLVIL